jgi:3'(2'), 5'-bisphosphate nucleotidase
MSNNLAQLLPQAAAIARRAGAAIMEVYLRAEGPVVEWKADDSPLTEADRAANAVINAGLDALAPRYPIVSEENAPIPFAERRHFERYWLVDPLDGTREFIGRNGEFTVNIALIEGGFPVLGVVYVPATAELYRAALGLGAWREREGETMPLRAARFRADAPGLRVLASRSHLDERTQAFIAGLSNPQLLQRGSSLKMMMLAAGQADLYPRLGPTSEWDTAAPQIILEEAGGQVLEWESRARLGYNKEDVANPYFLAQGEAV